MRIRTIVSITILSLGVVGSFWIVGGNDGHEKNPPSFVLNTGDLPVEPARKDAPDGNNASAYLYDLYSNAVNVGEFDQLDSPGNLTDRFIGAYASKVAENQGLEFQWSLQVAALLTHE